MACALLAYLNDMTHVLNKYMQWWEEGRTDMVYKIFCKYPRFNKREDMVVVVLTEYARKKRAAGYGAPPFLQKQE